MMQEEIPLVDVIHLSYELCTTPISGDLKYCYTENFVGRKVEGYDEKCTDICLLAPQAAYQLTQVQNYLNKEFGLGLIIFDAYRPLRAVRDFVKWFKESPTQYELERKEIHYPHLEKNQLSELGYIASNISNHCYGQSVDLTLLDLRSKRILNMGTCFDFFGELSHATMTEKELGIEAYNNRSRLFNAMHAFDYRVYSKEYWHFDFNVRENEKPLDIVICPDLRGIGQNLIKNLV